MIPFDQWNIKHQNRVEKDVAIIAELLDYFVYKIAIYSAKLNLKKKVFKFKDFPVLRKNVDDLLNNTALSIETKIEKGVNYHWELSEAKNDTFVSKLFKKYSYKSDPIATRNAEGLKGFRNRPNRELSSRVWKYSKQLRTELEMAIDTAIKEGVPANQLATKIKKYVKDPEYLHLAYRRNNGQLELLKNKITHKPGRGVYKSSFKNAERLARTELNSAYRLADIDRWSRLDFVIGYEIRRSKNPFPCATCEMMKGKYPKDFVWYGNHPNCRCYLVPILQSEDDFVRSQRNFIEKGEYLPPRKSVEINPKFIKWVNDNKNKILKAKSLPYFLKDNPKYVTSSIRNRITSEKVVSKLSHYKTKIVSKTKSVLSSLFSDVTGGIFALGIAGINKALSLYRTKKLNAEKVSILKSITQMKEFKPIRNISTKSNSVYGFNVKQYDDVLLKYEMPKNIVIAKKMLTNNYDIYLMPNPSKIKSADFIVVKNRKYYYYEAKTINGKSTLKARLREASTQSDRIILDIIGINNPKEIAENIKWFFNNFNTPIEVLLFKRGRIIKVTRQIAEKKSFEKLFVINWIGKGKKIRGSKL